MPKTPQFDLPMVQASQAQKHITVNEALIRLDAAAQFRVIDHAVSTPPGAPLEGDCYLVPFGAGGDWSGKQNDIAVYVNGGWEFFRPLAGWRLYNAAQGASMSYDGVTWLLGDAVFSPNGAAFVTRVIEYDLTLTAGSASSVVGALLGDTLVTGVSGRVSTAITGSATGWSLGVAGDTGRFGAGLAKGLNSTVMGLDTAPRRYDANTDLVVTAEGGTFSAGAVRLAVHMSYLLAPRI